MAKVLIDSENNETLKADILKNFGHYINFSNGCSLMFEHDFIEGSDPYGSFWGCNLDRDYLNNLIKWLAHWNEPRDE